MATLFFVMRDGEQPRDSGSRFAINEGRELLDWIGADGDGWAGMFDPIDLAARCRRRLWPEARNFDPELQDRPAGFLRGQTERLLELAERARELDEVVCYAEL